MGQTRQDTAYRKSRKFGDVYGGRVRPRVPDNIFRRAHSLKPPGPLDELPILIEENPSRNFFFPLSAREALEAVRALPQDAQSGLTHIWLRRASQRELASTRLPLAEFICGSGVRVVVLYPWRRDLRLSLGRRRPKGKVPRTYEQFGARIYRQRGWWYAEFAEAELRRFYVEQLLYHEIGHHVDWYRRYWSKANRKQLEDAADQYAVQWSRSTKQVINRLESTR